MLTDIWPTVSSVFGVLIVILIGGVCRQRDWLNEQADQSLAKLTAYVLMPAFFVDKILTGEAIESLQAAWMPPTIGFLTTAIGFAIGLLFARTIGKRLGLDTDAKQRAFALCVGICNYGYIPLPLAIKFYPTAVIDLILHNVGVDLALWSVGIAVLCGVNAGGWKRMLLNPPLLAVVFALTVRQSMPSGLPEFFMDAAALIGGCAIPMGLVLSGAIITDFVRQANWQGATKTVVAAIVIRQGLMPVLMLVSAALLVAPVDLRQVVMLQAAMPTAIFPIVLIKLYKKDTTTGLRVVLSTSIAAIVMIPFWMTVGKWWLGL